MRIYVAGRYSAPDEWTRVLNTKSAMTVGIAIIELGHEPFIPHLSHYVSEYANVSGHEIDYEEWMRQDMSWLRMCDALFYLNSSPGADRELALAESLGLTIYRHLYEIPKADGSTPEKQTVSGHPRFKELLDAAWKLHQEKSSEYGTDSDPLGNLHQQTEMGYRPSDAAVIEISNIGFRIRNHMRKINRGTDPKTVANSLRNALVDNAAFSYLAIILMEEEGIL